MSGVVNCSKPHTYFTHLNDLIDAWLALDFGLNM